MTFPQDAKDSGEEKPKRKLPDPEKFVKKASPPASNPAPGLPVTMSTTPSKQVQNGEGYSEPVTPTSFASPNSMMPPIPSGSQPTVSRYIYIYRQYYWNFPIWHLLEAIGQVQI